MIVSMWMSQEVVTIDAESSLSEAADRMAQQRIRRLPVVESTEHGPRLVGILARSDVYAAFPPQINPFSANAHDEFQSPVKVARVMTRHLLTTVPDAPLESAARLMQTNKVGALPVLHESRLVGILTESDIFRALVEMLAADAGDVRVTFFATPQEDVLHLVLRTAAATQVQLVSILSTQHADQPMCVVRARGEHIESFIDALWKTKHPPLSIVRT